MESGNLEETLADTLQEKSQRHHDFGEYHPSQVTGCPLKVVLDKMTDKKTIYNSWLMQGSAVHYWLQETGIMTDALTDAGFHPLNTKYEVGTHHRINDEVYLDGTCDILCNNDGRSFIFDIKYSSIPASSGHGRVYKYMSQANTYAHMFGADEYGLIMISSKSRDLLGMEDGHASDISVMMGEKSPDNWENVKRKARVIHSVLKEAGYDAGERWTKDMLEAADLEFWENVMEEITRQECPSYNKECNYCDHSEYCPVKQGKLGGLNALVD